MNRRSILKTLFLGTPTSVQSVEREQANTALKTEDTGISDKRWFVLSAQEGRQELLPGTPGMNWEIERGELACMAFSPDTTAYLSDYGLSPEGKSFKAEMVFTFNAEAIDQDKNDLRVGFRFSLTGNTSEIAQHVDAGLSSDGSLFIGKEEGDRLLTEKILKEPLRLVLSLINQSSGGCFAKLRVFDRSGNTLSTLSSTRYTSSNWQGSIGLLSHYTGTSIYDQPSLAVSNFKIDGDKLVEYESKDKPADLHISEINLNIE